MDSFEQSNRKVKIRFVSFPIIYIPIHVVELLNWCSIALISFVFLVNCVCQFVTSPCQRYELQVTTNLIQEMKNLTNTNKVNKIRAR